jgi:hypothetical protein
VYTRPSPLRSTPGPSPLLHHLFRFNARPDGSQCMSTWEVPATLTLATASLPKCSIDFTTSLFRISSISVCTLHLKPQASGLDCGFLTIVQNPLLSAFILPSPQKKTSTDTGALCSLDRIARLGRPGILALTRIQCLNYLNDILKFPTSYPRNFNPADQYMNHT